MPQMRNKVLFSFVIQKGQPICHPKRASHLLRKLPTPLGNTKPNSSITRQSIYHNSQPVGLALFFAPNCLFPSVKHDQVLHINHTASGHVTQWVNAIYTKQKRNVNCSLLA